MSDVFYLSDVKLKNGYSLDELQNTISSTIGNGNDSTVLLAELCLFIGLENEKHKKSAKRFVELFKRDI